MFKYLTDPIEMEEVTTKIEKLQQALAETEAKWREERWENVRMRRALVKIANCDVGEIQVGLSGGINQRQLAIRCKMEDIAREALGNDHH